VAGVAAAIRATRRRLDARAAPLAGLTAVFVFAAQMINFPVAAGTSGHLLGGALAAVLVGPAAGALALTVVLVLQAFLFADGGLSALGLNVANIALLVTAAAWGVFVVLRAVLPKSRASVSVAATVAAFVSVPVSSMGFVLQYALGGTGTVDLGTVLWSVLSVHVLIGIGEAAITGLVVASVMASRSDLVTGWRPRREGVPAVAS
jgi:cobalamin biosynthesis protein CbiM